MSNVIQMDMFKEDNEEEVVLSKEEHVKNYLKDLVATETAIEPLKEHKRDVRKSYIDNEWLSKDEIWAAVKAYRMVTAERDIDDLVEAYEQVRKMIL